MLAVRGETSSAATRAAPRDDLRASQRRDLQRREGWQEVAAPQVEPPPPNVRAGVAGRERLPAHGVEHEVGPQPELPLGVVAPTHHRAARE